VDDSPTAEAPTSNGGFYRTNPAAALVRRLFM